MRVWGKLQSLGILFAVCAAAGRASAEEPLAPLSAPAEVEAPPVLASFPEDNELVSPETTEAPGAEPRDVSPVDTSAERATRRTKLVSRTPARIALGLSGAVALGVGAALISNSSAAGEVDSAKLALGSALSLAGLGVGAASLLLSDSTVVCVSPGVASAPLAPGDRRNDAAALRDGLSGLTLSVRF